MQENTTETTQAAPVAAPAPTATVNGTAVTDWKSSLPDDIKGEPSLQHITDVPNLAKSYLNAQKLIGADKISVPSKHATPEDWKNVFKKLGAPETPDAYDLKVQDGTVVDENFLKGFKETAFKTNILPHQAKEMIDWYIKEADQVSQKMTKDAEMQKESAWAEIKKEFGQALEPKLAKARNAFKEFADEKTIEYFDQRGFSNDPVVVKLFAKIGEMISEDKISGVSKGAPIYAPNEASNEIGKIMADTSHPYHNSKHPNHKAAVEEMAKLFSYKFPQEDKHS